MLSTKSLVGMGSSSQHLGSVFLRIYKISDGCKSQERVSGEAVITVRQSCRIKARKAGAGGSTLVGKVMIKKECQAIYNYVVPNSGNLNNTGLLRKSFCPLTTLSNTACAIHEHEHVFRSVTVVGKL